MNKSIASLLTLALLCVIAEGLRDTCNVRYSSRVTLPCKPFGRCCRGGCRVQYSMFGSWNTELDKVASPLACRKQCVRHFRKCFGKCRCMAFLSEIRSSRKCKCVRSLSNPKFLRNCRNFCRDGYIKCRNRCITNRCPLVARTFVNVRIDSSGRCGTVCSKKCPGLQLAKALGEEDTTPIPANIDPLA